MNKEDWHFYKDIIESHDIKILNTLHTESLRRLVRVWYRVKKIRFVKPKIKDIYAFPPKYKISFCTNSMGRLNELKQTLIQNIEDNQSNPLFEYVILNYGNDTETNTFIQNNCMSYIESGILNYYSTMDPISYYKMCHSRNVTGKLATGDILAFIDANNFTMDFSFYLNAVPQFLKTEDLCFVMPGLRRGRIGLFKKDFLELGGYDETLDPRYWQDRDLEIRAEASGLKAVLYNRFAYYDKAEKGNKPNTKKEKKINKTKQFENFSSEHARIFESYRLRSDYVANLMRGSITRLLNHQLIANTEKHWGVGTFLKNFTEVVTVT